MARITYLLAIGIATVLSIALPAYAQCYNKCDFIFVDGQRNLFTDGLKSSSDTALSFDIGRKSFARDIGIVNVGEPHVYKNKQLTKISDYRPSGLKQRFSSSVFKTFRWFGGSTIDPFYHGSGVGHENLQQNQREYIDNLCVVLPITSYQVLNGTNARYDQRVIKNVHTTARSSCVAFKVMLQ